MKLTAALKSFVVVKGWLTADADDAAFRAKITEKMIAGEIDAAKIAELTAEGGNSSGVKSMIVATVNDALAPVLAQLAKIGGGTNNPDPAAKAAEDAKNAEAKRLADEAAAFEARVQKSVTDLLQKQGFAPGNQASPTRLFAGAALLKAKDAGVTKALDRFDRTKSALHYDARSKHVSLAGKRVTAPAEHGPGSGRPLDNNSTADNAVCGAYFKWALACNSPNEYPDGLKMTDLDHQIVQEALHELPWTGTAGKRDKGLDNQDGGIGVDNALLTETSRKALLDDSTSGGITMVPQVFDDAVIQYPLLYGELFPYVSVENLAMGRRIEAPTMARVTLTSGIAESTAIPLFDTTNFIGALDTVIQNVVGAIELGNDFQEDTPVANIGQRVIANYGEALQQWLDMVIAVGDGTTQPLGIFNTSGLTAVSSANSLQGPVSIGDFEGLMLGVSKAFRGSRGGNSNIFVGNEVTYRRTKGIPIGTAYNARVFGETYGDYMALGYPFRIALNATNSQLAFVNMAWYRMYRRLGGQIKVSRDTGKELVLRNVTLIAYRARYGGRMQAGAAASVISDLEA
jgi:hypothetical protein